MTLDELIATVNAMRGRESREQRFLAALNGIDVDEENPDQTEDDIINLKGFQAQQDGFGIGLGLGYMEIDE